MPEFLVDCDAAGTPIPGECAVCHVVEPQIVIFTSGRTGVRMCAKCLAEARLAIVSAKLHARHA